ncbi:hypothetical protein C8R44DRAFT_981238 [Mycena epipterygia]|nr:hypothetical protein C8R44DRAFT_981238 [Mycena epipterygia]
MSIPPSTSILKRSTVPESGARGRSSRSREWEEVPQLENLQLYHALRIINARPGLKYVGEALVIDLHCRQILPKKSGSELRSGSAVSTIHCIKVLAWHGLHCVALDCRDIAVNRKEPHSNPASLPPLDTSMHTTQCSECGAFSTSLSADGPNDLDINASPARHHELLTTNEPPDDAELAFIRAVISKTHARMAYLDTEISRLQQLEEERAALSTYHSQNIAILSPLRRIPPEVLCEIFLWTLPSAHEALRHRSRWRAAALSAPSLWSLVVMEYHDLPWLSTPSVYPLPMVQTQIQRAQKIKLHFYGSMQRSARPQVEMFRCLVEHSPRWEELSIELTPALLPLLANLRNRLQSLRRLWIQWDGAESQAGVESIDVFHVAPRLVDVGTNDEHRPIPMLLPAHQLTRYESTAPWEMHQTVLKLARNLVEAHLESGDPLPDHGDIVDLLCLQRLYVSHTELLTYLKTPALKEIAFYFQDDDPSPLIHLEPFVFRSGCTLQKLTLKGSPTTSATVELLEKYPSLTELAIIIHDLNEVDDDDDYAFQHQTDTLISQLAVPSLPTGNAALAPQLSGIHFGSMDGSYIDFSLYLQMLRSRWAAAGYALVRAALLTDAEPGPDDATLSDLDALRRDGLDLSFLQGEEASQVMNHWTSGARWH